MKIIIATPVYPPETSLTATYVKEVASRLNHDGNDITVITYANVAEDIEGVRTIMVKKSQPVVVRFLNYTFALFKATKNADVLFVQEVIASGLPALIVSLLRNIPIVLHLTQDEALKRNRKESTNKTRTMAGTLQKFILSHVTVIAVPSVHFAKIIGERYRIKKEKFTTLYNPPSKEQVLPFETKRERYHIIAISKLLNYKNIENLITILPSLKKEFPKIHLTISGDVAEESALKKLADNLGCEDTVTFLGKVSRAEESYLHDVGTICIVATENEDCSHQIMVNFAANTPTISEDIPCYREFISHKKSGLLIKLDDKKELERSIRTIFSDSSLSNQIRENGQKILSEKFSWNTHISALSRLFLSIKNPS